ncbi:ABC transporter permease [Marimonas arenosa]|uniref:ABC transmembrane type-1 domain-containing protein n=1 Tax=Marimonas arenosa TaxID=1795305 RepID=A0AAE3WBC3_9RHOB|nr:hypothetical protein [Marimonas arenosa]MDQ2090076.1 hypothetical protein [Marimonas arenosa]
MWFAGNAEALALASSRRPHGCVAAFPELEAGSGAMSQAAVLSRALPLAASRRVHVAGILLWALIAIGPLAALSATAFASMADVLEMAAYLIGRRWLGLLAKSIVLAGAVSTLAVALAVALVRWTRSAPGRVPKRLVYLPLLLLLVPPYLHATAWISAGVTVQNGLVQIGLQLPSVPGMIGVVWMQLVAVFPVALGFTLVGFRMTDPALTEAGRVFASDLVVFRKIEWPQMRATVLIGWVLACLLSLADFSVPSLMQVEVFALEAFVEYSIAADEVAALIVAFPHLLIGLALMVSIAAPVRTLAIMPARPSGAGQAIGAATSWSLRVPGQIAFGFALLQVAVPVIALGVAALPLGNLASSIAENGREIVNSLITAGFSGALSVVFALVALPMLTTVPRLAVVMIPLAVPAALVGIGAIGLWTLPGLELLYNTAAMPVLVAVAQFSPVAILALFVQAHRCDRTLIEAAQVYRGDGLATWRTIYLPLWAPGLWAGFFAVFGLTLTELTATLLVSPPGRQTLTVKIYSLLHYGASDRVAALCLMVLLGSVAASAVVFAAMAGGQRDGRRGSE